KPASSHLTLVLDIVAETLEVPMMRGNHMYPVFCLGTPRTLYGFVQYTLSGTSPVVEDGQEKWDESEAVKVVEPPLKNGTPRPVAFAMTFTRTLAESSSEYDRLYQLFALR